MRFFALIGGILLALLGGCTGDRTTSLAPGPTATPVEEWTARRANASASSSSVDRSRSTSAQDPKWSIAVEPGEGDCAGPRIVTGSGFEANTEVVLLRWASLNDLESIDASRTDAAGRFSMPFPAGGLGTCGAGLEAVFEVRTTDRLGDHAGGWPRAVYRVPSVPLKLDPARGRCQQRFAVRGDGFTPGARVTVFMGSADPFAHNFATLADSAADATGRLDVEVELHLPPSCRAGEVGIFASGEGESSRRKAIFTVTGP